MFAAKCILNKEERRNKTHKFKKEEFASMYLRIQCINTEYGNGGFR
jgi:hypothetical protein